MSFVVSSLAFVVAVEKFGPVTISRVTGPIMRVLFLLRCFPGRPLSDKGREGGRNLSQQNDRSTDHVAGRDKGRGLYRHLAFFVLSGRTRRPEFDSLTLVFFFFFQDFPLYLVV